MTTALSHATSVSAFDLYAAVRARSCGRSHRTTSRSATPPDPLRSPHKQDVRAIEPPIEGSSSTGAGAVATRQTRKRRAASSPLPRFVPSESLPGAATDARIRPGSGAARVPLEDRLRNAAGRIGVGARRVVRRSQQRGAVERRGADRRGRGFRPRSVGPYMERPGGGVGGELVGGVCRPRRGSRTARRAGTWHVGRPGAATRKLSLTWLAFGSSYSICVRPPSGRQDCDELRLRRSAVRDPARAGRATLVEVIRVLRACAAVAARRSDSRCRLFRRPHLPRPTASDAISGLAHAGIQCVILIMDARSTAVRRASGVGP
jgi:hypothetical protein